MKKKDGAIGVVEYRGSWYIQRLRDGARGFNDYPTAERAQREADRLTAQQHTTPTEATT